jgi:hypothetical protein
MNLKRTTIVLVSAVALAAWFAAAMTPGRAPVLPAPIAPTPVDRTGDELANEIARLRERLRPDPAPREPIRNPFAFRAAPLPASSAPLAGRGATGTGAAGAGDAEPPVRLRLMLAGVAEDPAPDGVQRTAIITGNGQLALAKEGETVTDRGVAYEVRTIAADSVELRDLRDGTTHRLTLK